MTFFERLQDLCNKKGIRVTTLCQKLEISTSKRTAWSKGSLPSAEVLVKMSDYFDVSIDYLLKGEGFISIQERKIGENDLYADKIYNRIVLLCNFKGIDVDKIHEEKDLHISKKDVESWKNGAAPNFKALKELSIKFGVPLKYLMFGNILERDKKFDELKEKMSKLNVSWEHLSAYSNVDLNIFDYIDEMAPIGTLHFSVQNSIQNLLCNNNDFHLDLSLDDYKYAIISREDADDFLSIYNLSPQYRDMVYKYIEQLNNESIERYDSVRPAFPNKHFAILTDDEYQDLIKSRRQRETQSTSGTA